MWEDFCFYYELWKKISVGHNRMIKIKKWYEKKRKEKFFSILQKKNKTHTHTALREETKGKEKTWINDQSQAFGLSTLWMGLIVFWRRLTDWLCLSGRNERGGKHHLAVWEQQVAAGGRWQPRLERRALLISLLFLSRARDFGEPHVDLTSECGSTPTSLAKRVFLFKCQMVAEGGRGRPSDKTVIVFYKKNKWREGKGTERERARGDDDCFPLLARLLLPTEEIVRHPRFADRSLRSGMMASTMRSLSPHPSIPLSLFSPALFYLSICHLISIMFSHIIASHCR